MTTYLVPLTGMESEECREEKCLEAEISHSLDNAQRYALIVVELLDNKVKNLTIINIPRSTLEISTNNIDYIVLRRCNGEKASINVGNVKVIYTKARTLSEFIDYILREIYKDVLIQ